MCDYEHVLQSTHGNSKDHVKDGIERMTCRNSSREKARQQAARSRGSASSGKAVREIVVPADMLASCFERLIEVEPEGVTG